MVNYGKGIIYKLCSKDPNITECYVGSTCSFGRRKSQHKNTCYNENDNKYTKNPYVFIRETGGWDNWDMIQIEQYEAKDKRDLETRERYYIEILKSSLNSVIPTRSLKEYYFDNIEKIKEKQKVYHSTNADKISQRRKKYYSENSEKILQQQKVYNSANADKINERQRIYNSKNSEKISKNKKRYRAEKADNIKAQKKTPYHCDICNTDITNSGKQQHFRTKKHINNSLKVNP